MEGILLVVLAQEGGKALYNLRLLPTARLQFPAVQMTQQVT